MFLVQKSICFDKWLTKLKDKLAKARILVLIKKLENGNLGDYRSVGGKVSELKIDYGPDYRVYFTRKGNTVIWLLCGGDKSSQQQDIKRAQQILKELEMEK
ncbi:MAG: type II toxin-antitoxin system RelE/ParE family toxin [Kiritimatiellae bacterium]|nr:type II toxin-antitoxin system RelE/ParE family toxin [Kiritimatiellia bacterium]MDD2600714.1 type II toxin-antitoxin system RelE/ParE family toxin [Kiritimatiellia bacterium]